MSDRIESITMDSKNYWTNTHTNAIQWQCHIAYKSVGSSRQDILVLNLGSDERKAYARLERITGLMLP